jgi:DNA polymerase-1
MYDYIQEAIEQGECLLEWDEAHEAGPPPVPLLKDKFGGERRKAKVCMFVHACFAAAALHVCAILQASC